MSTPAAEAAIRPFRVTMTCAAFLPGFRAGGPIRSATRIVDTVSRNIDLSLVTSDRDLGDTEPYPDLSGRWVQRGRSRVFYLNTSSGKHWLEIVRLLRRQPTDLLYVNSLWALKFSVVPILAARLGVIRAPRIMIAPRGELSPGALSLKATKKKHFLRFWSPVLRSMQVIWHASADLEAREIRAVFPWAKVLINQDQSSLPDEPLAPDLRPDGAARFVFISRISPKKNLDEVLDALRSVSAPVHFDIYGPIEDQEYWSKCEALIRALPTHVTAAYRGELAPVDVRRTFATYDAFVFPTRGENFGHVIAESLSASCPVVCSDATPWTRLLQNGGGAVTGPAPDDCLPALLQRFAAAGPEHRASARERAGDAYRSWRSQVDRTNILDVVRSTVLGPSR